MPYNRHFFKFHTKLQMIFMLFTENLILGLLVKEIFTFGTYINGAFYLGVFYLGAFYWGAFYFGAYDTLLGGLNLIFCQNKS